MKKLMLHACSCQTNKYKPHHPWYSTKTLTYGKIFVSASPCYFVYYNMDHIFFSVPSDVSFGACKVWFIIIFKNYAM